MVGLDRTGIGLADFGPGEGTVFDETAAAEGNLTIVCHDANDHGEAEQAPERSGVAGDCPAWNCDAVRIEHAVVHQPCDRGPTET